MNLKLPKLSHKVHGMWIVSLSFYLLYAIIVQVIFIELGFDFNENFLYGIPVLLTYIVFLHYDCHEKLAYWYLHGIFKIPEEELR